MNKDAYVDVERPDSIGPDHAEPVYCEDHGLSSAGIFVANNKTSPESGALEKKATWITVGFLQCCDVLGVGILAIGHAFAELGWFLGFLASITFTILCVYLGILQWECQKVFPRGNSQKNMTLVLFKSRVFAGIVAGMLYTLLFLLQGVYLLALTSTLQGLFHGTVDLCQYVWCAIAALFLVPFLFIRNLSGMRYITKFSVMLIILAVALTVGFIIYQMSTGAKSESSGTDVVFPKGANISGLMSGFSHICLAYCGLVVFLEMSSEMKNMDDFPKAFYISVPIELGLVAIVSVVSYMYQGENADNLLNVIPKEYTMYKIVNGVLFVYLISAFSIKNIIISRALHAELSPVMVNARGIKPMLQHLGIGGGILTLAYLVANAVPIFSLIVDFCGAGFVPFLGYILPIIFAVKLRLLLGQKIKIWEWFVWTITVAFFSGLTVFGTYTNIVSLKDSYAAGNTPFAC